MTKNVFLHCYLAIVRPYLDYAVQFWSSYYRVDLIPYSVKNELIKLYTNTESPIQTDLGN